MRYTIGRELVPNCDERSREHYVQLRSKGHSHGRALRGVADRLLAVLIAMLKNGGTYNPTFRHHCFEGRQM